MACGAANGKSRYSRISVNKNLGTGGLKIAMVERRDISPISDFGRSLCVIKPIFPLAQKPKQSWHSYLRRSDLNCRLGKTGLNTSTHRSIATYKSLMGFKLLSRHQQPVNIWTPSFLIRENNGVGTLLQVAMQRAASSFGRVMSGRQESHPLRLSIDSNVGMS